MGSQASGAALMQNGVVYVAGWYGTLATSWTTYTLTGLTAADFHPWLDTSIHPDFSANGAPIQLGFYRGNSTYSGGYTTVCGADNWGMTITSDLPTPALETSWGRVKATYLQ